jgi:two-component system response regulator MprA
MSTHVLVIDDDEHILRMLRRVLRVADHQVKVALDGREGLALAGQIKPDLIILDIMMPGPDGFEICRQLRQRTKAPILMLTALASPDHEVEGLEAGADDYLVKPFGIEVLLARVRALLRRAQAHPGLMIPAPRELRYANLTLNTGTQAANRAGRSLALGPIEFRLLHLFMEHPERVLTHEQLRAAIWGSASASTSNVLAVQICGLRDELERDDQPRLIHTARRNGYILRQ